MSTRIEDLGVRIFTDGADAARMLELAADPLVQGFTTNPTLMRQAGVQNYLAFVKDLTTQITEHPISFEVISDDFAEMESQAMLLREFGDNVYVKVPVTDTSGASAAPLLERLATAGVKVNATALMTLDQVRTVTAALGGGPPAVVSVFAGRIADAGVDPVPIMREAKSLLRPSSNLELLWASPREVLNIVQADQVGCDIITLTPDLLKKVRSLGRDLADFSLATVKMFRDDAVSSRFEL